MNVGKRILYYLERNEMQQKELAQKINMDAAVLNRIIKGSRPARDNELLAIANVFNIPVDELYGRDAPRYYTNDETAEIANALKEGDGTLRVLFDAARGLPPETMKEAANYIRFLKAKQHPEEDAP